jgi:hypothetical protein
VLALVFQVSFDESLNMLERVKRADSIYPI